MRVAFKDSDEVGNRKMQRLNSFPSIPSFGEMLSAEFWRQKSHDVAKVKIPTKADFKRLLRKYSPKANYYYFHLSYFVIFMLIGGAIIWGIERSNSNIGYIDALYTSVSAMSETGLTSKDFSKFRTGSQAVVSIIILIGGGVLLSAVPPILRLIYYKRQLRTAFAADEFLAKSKRLLKTYIRLCELLLGIVVAYWALCQLIPFLMYGLYLQFSQKGQEIMQSRGMNAWWFALFHSISAFNNAGFSLFNDNLEAFQNVTLVQLVSTFQIAAGNTLFPAYLRLMTWAITFFTLKFVSSSSTTAKALKLLLTEPRFFYTHLYPSKQTVILVYAWIAMTAVEYAVFFKEWDNPDVLKNHTVGEKLLIMWFQTVSVRTAGFNNVDIGSFSVAHLTIYVFTMYISSYPIIVSMRASAPSSRQNSYKKQLKHLMTRDWIWLYMSVLTIAFIEEMSAKDFFKEGKMFLHLLFEVSSAFGTVGLSMGCNWVPGCVTSFSGVLHPVSRFVIILVMVAGRHRGLPFSVDPAVNLSAEIEREIVEIRRRVSQKKPSRYSHKHHPKKAQLTKRQRKESASAIFYVQSQELVSIPETDESIDAMDSIEESPISTRTGTPCDVLDARPRFTFEVPDAEIDLDIEDSQSQDDSERV